MLDVNRVEKSIFSDNKLFVFLVEFSPRNSQYNVDQLGEGTTVELVYKDTKFPLYYFSHFTGFDIKTSITFYNFILENSFELANVVNNSSSNIFSLNSS